MKSRPFSGARRPRRSAGVMLWAALALAVSLAGCALAASPLVGTAMAAPAMLVPVGGRPPIAVRVSADEPGLPIHVNGRPTSWLEPTMIQVAEGDSVAVYGPVPGLWVVREKDERVHFTSEPAPEGLRLVAVVNGERKPLGYQIEHPMSPAEYRTLVERAEPMRVLGLEFCRTAQTTGCDADPLVEPLAWHHGLWALIAPGTGASDLSPLADLRQLRHLDLSGTPVRDLSPLAGLMRLVRLDLAGSAISDLSPISGLTTLRWLDVSGTAVESVSALFELRLLAHLDLSGTRVHDLSALGGLQELNDLNLAGTPVADLAPLFGLTALERVVLTGSAVDAEERAALAARLPRCRIID